MMLMLLVACATTREERQEVRTDRHQLVLLQDSAELYWKALRWDDVGTAAGFLQDGTYRTDWLTGPAMQTDWRYREATIMRADLGPTVDEGDPRTATVIVNVQGYTTRSQVLESSVVTQDWYFDDRSWWVEPGQERGVQR